MLTLQDAIRKAVVAGSLVWCCACLSNSLTFAQQIVDVSPRGLQLDGTTRVVFSTKEIKGSPADVRVLLGRGHELEATVESIREDKLIAHVRVDQALAPSIYPIRVVTTQGVSNATLIGVDRLRQLTFRDEIVALPCALNGVLTGDQVLETSFIGRTGDGVVIDVEANRLGSKLRPVVRVYGPSGRQIAMARPSRRISGDARLSTVLTETGVFRVELQDILFKGAKEGWFRLKIGDLQYADGVFPMCVATTGTHRVQLVSTSQPRGFEIQTEPVFGQTIFPLPVRSAPRWATGLWPSIRLSSLGPNECVESSVQHRQLQSPVAINGRLNRAGEQDEYAVSVRPNQKVKVELFSARWGSDLDGVIEVFDTSGEQLARSDDQTDTTDPVAEVTIPHDHDQIRVRVSSLTRSGGPTHTYRVAITPVPLSQQSASLGIDRVRLPAGGRWVLPVQMQRSGASSDMRVDLPPSLRSVLRLDSKNIFGADEQGLISILAAPQSQGLFVARLSGLAKGESEPVTLKVSGYPGSQHLAAAGRDLFVMVSGRSSLNVVWTLMQASNLVRGTEMPIQIRLDRKNKGNQGPVRLTLVTSQTPRTKEKDGKRVSAPEAELRLKQPLIIPPGQSKGVAHLVVPNGLPLHAWRLSLRADVLDADQKTVLSTTFSPVKSLATIAPLILRYDPPEKLEVKAGEWVTITGRVERHPDFVRPVTVSFAGLGDGEPAPSKVELAAGEQTFVLALRYPADAKAKEINDVRVIATFTEPPASLADVNRESKAFTVNVVPVK